MAPWDIEFYRTERGLSPIDEFIDELQPRDLRATIRLMTALEQVGPALRFPHARHIDGPLWELRPGRARFFYIIAGRTIWVLHAYRKKTQEAPPREIELAFRRLGELERRGELGSQKP
jgi:phage-related protein